jgi:O-antigen/teichoic acid export membrane protein
MRFDYGNSNTLQAFWVGFGSLSSFSMTIISTMILSRYFEKAEFGTYRQIIYVYNTLLVVFSAGLPKAFSYFLPQQSLEQGNDIVKKITKVFFLVGFLFSLSLYLGAPVISAILKNPELTPGIKLFSPIPLLLMPTLGIEGIFSTLRKTHVITIYNFSTRVFMLLAITLPVIVFGGDYKMAIYGWSVSSFLTFILAMYLKSLPYHKINSVKSDYSLRDIFKYTFPLMQASLYGIALGFADQFFISRYFGPVTFAEFSNGFMEIPLVMMITGATSTVLTPLYVKYLHMDDGIKMITENWKNTMIKSALIIYPLVIFFMFFAKDTMLLLYGNKYLVSGTYFNIAMVINFLNIIVIGSLLFAMGETKFYGRVFLISVFIIWGVDFILVKLFMNPYLIAISSVSLRVIRIIFLLWFVAKRLKISIYEFIPLIKFAKIIGHALVVVVPIKIVIMYTEKDIHNLFMLVIAFVVYCVVLLLSQNVVSMNYLATANEIITALKKKRS